MLFNSFTYAIFLIIIFGTYWLLPNKWRNYFLLLSSYFFYGIWKIEGLLLLLGFSIVNWLLGLLLNSFHGRKRKGILGIGIFLNIAILCVFKYYNFFLDNIDFLWDKHHWLFADFKIFLPLGISFFVFEAISFLVDTYKGENTLTDFQSFALYISFFPHLIAGPIVRVKQLSPQLITDKRFSLAAFLTGLDLLCIGAFKKVVLADNLASFVDISFKTSHSSAWDIWITGGLFSMQIYLDFAGYTDMARGSAKLLGYDLPINFDFPYVSRSIGEFWRRWHITLSNWLRDYLYIPLGGNRAGQNRTYINLIITMSLGGLWHGAGWTYIIWGFYQGVALVVHRVFASSQIAKSFFEQTLWGQFSAWMLTYLTVIIGWIIFRSHDVFQLSSWMQTLLTPTAYIQSSQHWLWGVMVIVALIVLKVLFEFCQRGYQSNKMNKLRPILYITVLFSLALFAPQSQQFIYFQF
ncbi:MBOAT family O-acyltransferase [Nostoc sp.]|uniref:MBOAT family O-acyltransferase n=1 Tax=Nostoc sp. TaxID=1180 RepID=UPI002FFCB1F8